MAPLTPAAYLRRKQRRTRNRAMEHTPKELTRAARPMATCSWCGHAFMRVQRPRRGEAVYCKDGHRIAAWRAKQRAARTAAVQDTPTP